jgi:hypothetical protein
VAAGGFALKLCMFEVAKHKTTIGAQWEDSPSCNGRRRVL